jgi:outer membrane lipoprotein-sorting protein
MRTPSVAALLACGCLFVCGAAWAAQSDFDQLMSALSQRKHGHVTFVEKKFLAVLDRPVESSGELLYDAPDRLEKRTLKPKPATLVLTGDVVTAKRGHREYVLDLQQYPQVVPLIESIRATLAGDRAALERVFDAKLDGGFAHWTLDLVPRDSKLAASVRKIVLAGETDQIQTIEIQEVDGDRSVLTIGAEVAQ